MWLCVIGTEPSVRFRSERGEELFEVGDEPILASVVLGAYIKQHGAARKLEENRLGPADVDEVRPHRGTRHGGEEPRGIPLM